MKKLILLIFAYVIFSSHDMFLKMGTYFLNPNTPSTIKLYNGTFDKSENIIARTRMQDVSLVGNGTRTRVDSNLWSEMNNITILNFNSGEAGTWVAGVSTTANSIELNAQDFNEYLDHDGVLDMLNWRKENNAMEEDAIEKYSKHVKAIFQVGDKNTEDWKTVLGYPIEFVPTSNPYHFHSGDDFSAHLLLNGQPLADQLVYVGSDTQDHGHTHDEGEGHDHDDGHSHDNDEASSHDHDDGDDGHAEEHQHNATQLTTDENGMVTFTPDHEGQWYLRTIYMETVEDAELTHESNWATLTFEIGHGHSHGEAISQTTETAGGMPNYIYWLGGIVMLLLVIILMKRKNSAQ
ncbi:MAG: DUF4198 domain-containing protein [Saprospiraceae bacterium]|nr:DUF4198 domain-containing protein [Saprospiraceae bacterium]